MTLPEMFLPMPQNFPLSVIQEQGQVLSRGRENGYLLNSELKLFAYVSNHNIWAQNLKKFLLEVGFSASFLSFSSFASNSQSKNRQQKPLMNKNQQKPPIYYRNKISPFKHTQRCISPTFPLHSTYK